MQRLYKEAEKPIGNDVFKVHICKNQNSADNLNGTILMKKSRVTTEVICKRNNFFRVLWVCNIVLPEFSAEFNISPTCYGGWMSGMLRQLEQVDELVVGLCFPIIDEARMKNSVHNGHPFYSFHASMDSGEYRTDASLEFLDILRDFKPDIIHIWGTEFNHAKAMIDACVQLGFKDKVIVHIQGLLSYYAIHYALGIDLSFLECGRSRTILDEKEDFVRRGKVEQSLLKQVVHISGRTEWDRSCSLQSALDAQYYDCDEILRPEFYQENRIWSPRNCQKYRIFLSQASYPVKGIHFFLRAMKIIQEKFPEVEVYVGGHSPLSGNSDGEVSPYGAYLQGSFDLGTEVDCIHFLGNLTALEMVSQYLQANVFVSPSTIENSSNSICEAMLLGVPVVASYVGGTPSLLHHGEDGFLYPCDAYYMLAYYIMQIFQDDELAGRISAAARERARKRHDPEKIGNRMMEIYHIIASS